MYPYTILQWLLFLYIYCFIGWCWETAYVSIAKRKYVNRGFMHGPFLPIYGTGAIMMLVVSAPFQDNLWLTYLAGVVGATSLELVTGTAMELLFKVRYWDYSEKRFNYKGYICLSSSVAWGFFTILMTRYLHKPVEQLVLNLPAVFSRWLTIALTIYVLLDFGASFWGAINLRNLLDKMERAREELAIMERRLDAMIAFTVGMENEKKDDHWYNRLGLSELKSRISERFAAMKESIQGSMSELQEEISQQEGKFQELIRNEKSISAFRKNRQRRRVFNNPTMVSKRYQNSLNELKRVMSEGRKNKKNK